MQTNAVKGSKKYREEQIGMVKRAVGMRPLSTSQYGKKAARIFGTFPQECVGTSDVMKFALYSNHYYNQEKIYWKFTHVKDMPCHVSGISSVMSRSGEILVIARIASGDHLY